MKKMLQLLCAMLIQVKLLDVMELVQKYLKSVVETPSLSIHQELTVLSNVH